MMQHFFRDEEERANVETFEGITFDFPDIHFFQPSPRKAPWHWQAFLDAPDNMHGQIELNFWPHVMKGQRRPLKSVQGAAAIIDLLNEALADAAGENDFDVIEAAE